MYTEFINPIYAVHDGMPVIIIGARTTDMSMNFVFIGEDGMLGSDTIAQFVIDVRYKDGEWHDVSPGPQSDIIE